MNTMLIVFSQWALDLDGTAMSDKVRFMVICGLTMNAINYAFCSRVIKQNQCAKK